MATLHEDQCTFFIISRSVILRMRNVSGKICRENKTHILYLILFFPQNRAVYEIIWRNILQPDRPQMTILRRHIVRWVPTATDTHSEYVTPIASPQQQWLQEPAWLLRYTYISCLDKICLHSVILLLHLLAILCDCENKARNEYHEVELLHLDLYTY